MSSLITAWHEFFPLSTHTLWENVFTDNSRNLFNWPTKLYLLFLKTNTGVEVVFLLLVKDVRRNCHSVCGRFRTEWRPINRAGFLAPNAKKASSTNNIWSDINRFTLDSFGITVKPVEKGLTMIPTTKCTWDPTRVEVPVYNVWENLWQKTIIWLSSIGSHGSVQIFVRKVWKGV